MSGQLGLLEPCRLPGCKNGQREREPGRWEDCPRCHGSGTEPLEDDSAPRRARARSTDPWTSHAAARSVKDLNGYQQLVLECLRKLGPSTDEELVEYILSFHHGELPRGATASGIRTRRRELVDREPPLVHDTGRIGRTKADRPTKVWAAI